MVCRFGYIQNSYGYVGAQGQKARKLSVANICRGPLDSIDIILHAGQFPFSFMYLCDALASNSIVGGMPEKVTIFIQPSDSILDN